MKDKEIIEGSKYGTRKKYLRKRGAIANSKAVDPLAAKVGCSNGSYRDEHGECKPVSMEQGQHHAKEAIRLRKTDPKSAAFHYQQASLHFRDVAPKSRNPDHWGRVSKVYSDYAQKLGESYSQMEMKDNNRPRKDRLQDRIDSLMLRQARAWKKEKGNPYRICKGCNYAEPDISIHGHGKYCPHKGLSKEIAHYQSLLSQEVGESFQGEKNMRGSLKSLVANLREAVYGDKEFNVAQATGTEPGMPDPSAETPGSSSDESEDDAPVAGEPS